MQQAEDAEEEREGEAEGELPPIVDANTLITVPRSVSEGPKGGPWSNSKKSAVRDPHTQPAHVLPWARCAGVLRRTVPWLCASAR